MGCTKTLSFTELSTGETPLDDAAYVPGVDKIFGTVGPHIAKFNASTGAREAIVRIVGPAYGTCRLCYHAPLSTLYATVWNVPARQWFDPPMNWSIRGIYPINPTTLAVGSVLDVRFSAYSNQEWPLGPRHIFSAGGTYLYFAGYNGGINSATEIWRVDPSNLADNFSPTFGESVGGGSGFNQIATDGLHVFGASPSYFEIQTFDMNLTNGSYDFCTLVAPEQGVDNPVAVAFSTVTNRVYAVCATNKLIRVDNFPLSTYTVLNLNGTSGMPGGTNPRPTRIRFSPLDSKLYIPCQGANGVVVWDTATETGLWKPGFDFPIDVVFTGAKAFAVQHGLTALKEIV